MDTQRSLASEAPLLVMESVSKVYRKDGGEVRALDDVTLSVARGEFVLVAGPSGSGKSTLLLTAGAMVSPTAGRVCLAGESLYDGSGVDRSRIRAERVGFVFQLFHLIPYLTVRENVEVVALAGVTDRGGLAQRAEHLIDHFGLGSRAGHFPGELSVGERQRVALARALVGTPPLVLADEPTGSLDAENASRLLHFLKEYQAGGGTVLLVSHDDSVRGYADRVLRMQAGRIVS